MLIFDSIYGLMLGNELVGLRVKHFKLHHDVSIEALRANGLPADFKPEKSRKLQEHGDLLLTAGEISTGKIVKNSSDNVVFVKSLVSYIKLIPRILTPENIAPLPARQKAAAEKLIGYIGQHIVTKDFGDGEVLLALYTEDGNNMEVIFHSNREGALFLGAKEFTSNIPRKRSATAAQ